MSTCTHVFFGLPCTRNFKEKQTWHFLGGGGRIIRSCHLLDLYTSRADLESFILNSTYAFSFVTVPSGFNQLTPSPLTQAMSVVPVGIGACDCWLCQGKPTTQKPET